MNEARKPDIEFSRKMKGGWVKSYGHIYFKPLIVHLFGKTIIGKSNLKSKSGGIKNEENKRNM
jgi:hypothetical protein